MCRSSPNNCPYCLLTNYALPLGHQYLTGTSFLAPQSIMDKPIIIWMNEVHCMLLVSYIQQYFNTSTVLHNEHVSQWQEVVLLFQE